jgi:hypothetical protein
MIDGKIVQTLPSRGGLYSMGFRHGGRTVWTHGQGVTAFMMFAHKATSKRNGSSWSFRVIRVGLAGPRRLPVYPGERTFSG